ncbi:MAG: TIM barrel protein [Acetivibrionales bacterium]|jgi:sugar phosphate isomerase/epimerase
MELSFALPLVDGMDPDEMERHLRELSAMGYVAVEYLINDPDKVDKPILRSLLDKYDMKISGFRTGAIYGADSSLRLSNPDETDRHRAIECLKKVCRLSGEFNTYVMVGLMQGHLGKNEEFSQAQQLIIDSLREISEYAGETGTTIMYEPVNRFELEYHNNVQEMVEVVERINDGIKHPVLLLLDVYHMHLEDPSVPSALVRGMKWMGHVHFSDSTRMPPGFGSIDFVEVLKMLYAMNYKGYVTVECLPVPSLLESARLSMEFLAPIMKSLERCYHF